MKEQTKDRVGKLLLVSAADLDRVLFVHRFCRKQKGRFSVFGNYTSNGTSAISLVSDAVTHDRADMVSAAALEMQQELNVAGLAPEVEVGLSEFVDAFETHAPEEAQRWLMRVLVSEPSVGRRMFGEMLTIPMPSWRRRGRVAQRSGTVLCTELVVSMTPAWSRWKQKRLYQDAAPLLG